jgi:hypothetical protein
MTHKHRTLKQNLKRWVKPYQFSTKKYSPRQKLVTFNTLVHSRNIRDVLNQMHKIDTEIGHYTNKLAKGRMMGGLEVTKKGLPAMRLSQARWLMWLN